MSPYIKPIFQTISKVADKTVNVFEDKFINQTYQQFLEKRRLDRIVSRKAGKKTAKQMGLAPVENNEMKMKIILNLRIIKEVKRRKLTHQQVGWFVCASRPKITRMMNQNLRGISIEFLIRILSTLGISVSLHLTSE